MLNKEFLHASDSDQRNLAIGTSPSLYNNEPPPEWLLDLKRRIESGYNYNPDLDRPTSPLTPLPEELKPERHGYQETLLFLRGEHQHAPPNEKWHPEDRHKLKDIPVFPSPSFDLPPFSK